MPELVNAVGGGDLALEIRLETIYDKLMNRKGINNVEYEPEIYPGLRFQFDESVATVMLFGSGKYNIAGANSTKDLQNTCENVIELITSLRESGPKEVGTKYEFRNLVYKAEYARELDLPALAATSILENTTYNPKTHPSLHYQPKTDGGLFIIFRTGSVILTGIDNPDLCEEYFDRLFQDLDVLLQLH